VRRSPGLRGFFKDRGEPEAEIPRDQFIKLLRKPELLFEQLIVGVKKDLRAISKIDGDAALNELLDTDQKEAYFSSVASAMSVSVPVAKNFGKSAFGLPLMGAAVYSHMYAGLGNYCMQKTGRSIEESLRIATYYRTPVLYEEYKRMGYTDEDIRTILTKNFYMQYWSGSVFNDKRDPHIMNPMARMFYPSYSHISNGSTDLGRETEMQAARLYCMGVEGIPAPVTVINTGDTGHFTDGMMHALQHIIEAAERGYAMPLIFQINANNSAISARIDYGDHYGDNGDYGVQRVKKRFQMFGDLFNEGFITHAEDVSGGIQSMRSAVDQVLATGKPSYCVSRFPFRPGGHASDQSPAADQMLLDQYEQYKNTLVKQLCSSQGGMSGADVAAKLDDFCTKYDQATTHALTGNNILTRDEILELSCPGSTTVLDINEDPGEMMELPVSYLTGKGVKEFAGMGADIFGKAINREMDKADAEGRPCRYVHQENHHRNKTDTRGGVYGELSPIKDEHLDKFVGFMPQEAQVIQVGMGYRSVLEDPLIFVKGPHTPFNAHSLDHMKYAAFRYSDSGTHANHIYIFDGGSLATREKETIMDNGKPVERDIYLARVGEHHNSPEYAFLNPDANTVMCVPIDLNFLDRSLPEMVKLHDLGRMVLGVAPTAAFGQLHPALKIPKDTISMNDTFMVKIPGKKKPLNGKKLIVLTWGPETKMVAKTLMEEKLEATMLILTYMKPANSLVRYLDEFAMQGKECEVICVDPNPNSNFLGPVVLQLKKRIGYPDTLRFTEATIDNAYVPYGSGDNLLNSADIVTALKLRGVIEGGESMPKKKVGKKKPAAAPTKVTQTAAAAAPAKIEVVMAPMDGEGVVIKFVKKVGDAVEADELIAEIESDKANIEVTSPIDGVIEEIFVEGGKEMNVSPETKLATVKPTASSAAAEPSKPTPAQEYDGPATIVNAPMDAETATVSYKVQVGDTVEADDLLAEIESDKATVEVNAPCDGTVAELFQKGGVEMQITMDTQIASVQRFTPPGSSTILPTASMATPGSSMFLPGTLDQITPLTRHSIAMVENMTVSAGDTRVFHLEERIPFAGVVSKSKASGVTPVVAMIKALADAAEECGNKKLSADKKSMMTYGQVDIGVAMDFEGQLRVAVIRDASNKSMAEISADVKMFSGKGAKLSLADQNLEKVAWVASSMGKTATHAVIPVLPKGTTGIVGVGRTEEDTGKSTLIATICHATLTGIEGAKVFRAFVDKCS
jgi:pyruvate/2-oxoglutarate dehydrogenase complex dihydrolipoamide acyltransferase (E2) component